MSCCSTVCKVLKETYKRENVAISWKEMNEDEKKAFLPLQQHRPFLLRFGGSSSAGRGHVVTLGLHWTAARLPAVYAKERVPFLPIAFHAVLVRRHAVARKSFSCAV